MLQCNFPILLAYHLVTTSQVQFSILEKHDTSNQQPSTSVVPNDQTHDCIFFFRTLLLQPCGTTPPKEMPQVTPRAACGATDWKTRQSQTGWTWDQLWDPKFWFFGILSFHKHPGLLATFQTIVPIWSNLMKPIWKKNNRFGAAILFVKVKDTHRVYVVILCQNWRWC